MEYYHVLIIEDEENDKEERVVDLTEDDLIEKIVDPYRKGEPIFVNGKTIKTKSIGRIHIRKTEDSFYAISERLYEKERARRSRSDILYLTPYRNDSLAFWEGIDVLDDYITGPPGYESKSMNVTKEEKTTDNVKIFLVHGHNEEMKQTVARLIEKIGLKPIILHEQPSRGATIIEKFVEYSDVNFAIVLLSADDEMVADIEGKDKKVFRARQNVILELGFFLGRLGREKVIALYEADKNIEIPSDYQGVIFVPYTNNDSWKLPLLKEIKASGFNINMNNII